MDRTCGFTQNKYHGKYKKEGTSGFIDFHSILLPVFFNNIMEKMKIMSSKLNLNFLLM
jgi:hypothetical protein